MKTKAKNRWFAAIRSSLSILLLVAMYGTAIAQSRIITGKVIDGSNGQPLPGVNVLLKGTNHGTITDMDGKFSLSITEETQTLMFSFVGMKTIEMSAENRSVMDVSLEEELAQLNEVLVTGTGVPTEKRRLAFDVQSALIKDLPLVPTASIDQALVGRFAGAQIAPINGTPGSEINILLRGINTLNTGTQPMILVDGVQMGATTLSAIDPNSIEKVEVIQGAAASTIYGAQGANGVIQLFTKKGQSGKMKIDFSYGVAVSEFLNIGGLRKARTHGFETNSKNEVTVAGDTTVLLVQSDTTLRYNGNVGYNLLDSTSQWNKSYDQNIRYVDHFKMFFKPATTINYRLGISGGNENVDYNISVSNTLQESNFRGDGVNDRTNLSLNLGVKLTRGLRLQSGTQLIYTRNTVNYWEKQDYGLGINFSDLLNSRPIADFSKKDVDGNYGASFGPAAGANQFNPFYEYQYGSSLDKKIDILQNFNLAYSFPKYVEIDLLYGLNYRTNNFRHTVQNQSLNNNSNASNNWTGINNFENTGEIDVFSSDRTFQNVKATAYARFDFKNDFGMAIPLNSITQVTYDYRSDRSGRYSSYALGMPLLPPLTSTQGTTFNIPEDSKTEFVTFGYLINQHFDYKSLAGISAGFRSDYSSAFGRGSRPFTFPHANSYFRVSALDFWDNAGISNTILEWKLRAAYGEAGIQPRPFDRYVTLSTRTLGTSNALYIGANQNNPDLGVEVSKEFEAGTDIYLDGFNGNWLSNFMLSVSYWKRRTDDAIFNTPVAPSVGVGRLLDNALSLSSDGLQASLAATLMKTSRLSWNFTANFSQQQSLIAAVKGNQITVGNRVLKAGEPVGQFYGWLMLHSVDELRPDGKPFIPVDGDINPITNLPYPSQEVQSAFEVASNGWVVNRKSKQPYISTDRFSMGNPNPKFMMSFIQDISYKNSITLSFQLDWLNGNHLYNNTKQWMYRDGIHSDYEMPILINGDTAAWSAFYRGVYNATYWFKNYFVEDASFVRLRNVSVGVDVAKLFQIQKISRLQLVFTGRNLWTYTRYSGMDPEISTYGATNTRFESGASLSRGMDDNTQPNLRTYQFTFNIGL